MFVVFRADFGSCFLSVFRWGVVSHVPPKPMGVAIECSDGCILWRYLSKVDTSVVANISIVLEFEVLPA